MNSPFDSLKLNTIQRRPNDSYVFTLCMEGNAGEVQKFLETGQASRFDMDESGKGLLHVSDFTTLKTGILIDIKCSMHVEMAALT